MSLILDKYKYKKEFDKQKQNRNLKKNFKVQGKATYKNQQKQNSFFNNKKDKRRKSNDIYNTVDKYNDSNDFLLSSQNNPFSKSVIYSKNKNKTINNKIITNMKNKKNNNTTKRKNSLSNNKNKASKNNNSNFNLNKNPNRRANSSEINTNNLNIGGTYSSTTKLDSFEDKIIDKNYENDIDHDEIIIGSDKNNKNKSYKQNSLFKTVNFNQDFEIKIEEKLKYNKEENNKKENNNDDEDYSVNNAFENNKADFVIMYIDNYAKIINDDMLYMELQLLYEKILDLKNSYHVEYSKIINKFNNNKKYISLMIYKYKEMQKKLFNLLKIKEKLNSKNQIYNFITLQEKENKSYLKEINNKELNLWKNMLLGLENKFTFKNIGNSQDNKKQMRELFKKIVFNKYSAYKNKLNDIENKVVLKLMKMNNYKVLPEKKAKNHINNKSYNNNTYKNKYEKVALLKPKKGSNIKLYDYSSVFSNNINKKIYNKNNNKFRTYNNNNSIKKKAY